MSFLSKTMMTTTMRSPSRPLYLLIYASSRHHAHLLHEILKKESKYTKHDVG